MNLLPIKIERHLLRLGRLWKELRGTTGQTYVQDRVSQYRLMWKSAAEEIGAEFVELSDELWEIRHGNKMTRILNDVPAFDDSVTLDLAGMKPIVYRLLADQNIPVPEHLVFALDELNKAGSFLSKHPKGCVVKPANGTSSGQGITTHILTERELRRAAILASLFGRQLLIEPMIPGECFRILVLDGKMIHAVCRRSLRFRGDGISSVAKLITKANESLRKESKPVIEIDRDAQFTLQYQNLTIESIPEKDQTFSIKSVNDPVGERVEVRTVYNEVVTEEICNSLRETAETASSIIGSRFVGVDFITPDATIPLVEAGGIVNELNTTPGLHHHYDSKQEKYPKAAVLALVSLLEIK